MIISRTPFRISFFGGGTDYPDWYRENGGAVLATTINKYCYITCRYLPPFFDYKSRVVWSHVEYVNSVEEIQHPSVRETLAFMNVDDGVEIHHDGDLPARSGLGSSSSFTVGLLHALYALRGQMTSNRKLARDAIYIEQERLHEHVGIQDQIVTSFGGLNHVVISPDGGYDVQPLILGRERSALLQNHLMLFFTGISRNASDVAAAQIEAIPDKSGELHKISEMVDEGRNIVTGNADITHFGRLLHEAWLVKRSLSNRISTSEIDGIYEAGRHAGAVGGKLLGAGGGGFMLLFVRPEDQLNVKEELNSLLHVPFAFESSGSQIIFYDSDNDESA